MTRLATFVGVGALLGGCIPSAFVPDNDVFMDGPGYYGGEGTQVERVRLDAEVGRFNVDTRQGWGTVNSWEWGTTIDMRGEGNGFVMSFIDIQNVNLAELEAGDVLRGGNRVDDMDGAFNDNDAYVYALGCAGEENDYWEEDIPADEVEVTVVDVTDEEITVSFEATLEGTNQAMIGQVSIPNL